jgi:hypothetical protein
MAQPHSTQNYAVGKGILSIAEWSGGSIGAYFDMGDCLSMEVEPSVEKLDHYSHRSGFRTKDATSVIESNYTVTFELDEPCAENLARFLLGTLSGQNTILALQNTEQEYALRFVADNPRGPNQTWDFWKCTLSPAGALQLIGDEWMTMSIVADGLADEAGHATSPYFTVVSTEHTSTTTTTT